ncbi:MAG: TonB-dependent receptor [Candidatus Aerophobetes bacterium]|nr:TonB-dependent receptor [Candidatus Aerophobetes bacterium]
MRKILLFLPVILVLVPISVWAQDEEPLPTELPTIVVKGKDRSSLEIVREKSLPPLSYEGKKELALSPGVSPLRKRGYYSPSLPLLERRPSVEIAPKRAKKILPVSLPLLSLSTSFAGYSPPPGIREKSLPSPQYEGKKELALSPGVSPLRKRGYPALKRSSLPYLHFSASMDENSGFVYQLNYGRKQKDTTHFLNLERTFSDNWVEYREGISLGRDIDKGNMDIIWNSSEKKEILVSLKGEKERVDLPDEEKREKSRIGIKGDWSLKSKSNNFKIKGLAERTALNDPEENYERNLLGLQLELKMRETPLSIGAGADWEDFTEKTEAYLGVNGIITLWSEKEKRLSLDIGGKVKWLENKEGEFLPSLKASYQASPKLSFQIMGEREISLLRFSDLYLPYDYIEINEDISPVRVLNYEINVKYSPSNKTSFLLRGFRREGEDTIWNSKESGFTKPVIRDILLLGAELSILHKFSETFEQEFVYTYQSAKNTEDKDRVIPYYPETSGALLLRWNQGGWRIEVEGEMIGERWSNELDKENNEEELSLCYKERLTIAKKIGRDVEGFIQWERDESKLWKDYSFPHPEFSLGVEVRLF